MDINQKTASWAQLWSPGSRIPLMVLGTGVLLHSMNALLMSTIMPSAVNDIGGLAFITWPSTAFLATSVVAASAGSVAQAHLGAKRAYIFAALLFGLGSLLAAVAPNIGVLIAGRAVQGVGGGLLSALTYVMVRNVFDAALWPRIFAFFSSVWGIAVFAGPLIGGVFSSIGFWRGGFYIVAVIATGLAVIAGTVLPAAQDEQTAPFFPGLRLLLIAIGIAFISMAAPATEINTQLIFIGLSALSFVAMLILDRKSARHILPTDAFAITTSVGLGMWVLLLVSIANDPFPIYGPLFLQTIHGMDPLAAGYLVAVEALAWTVAAAIVASLPSRYIDYCKVIGPVAMGLGLIGISIWTSSGPLWLLAIALFFAGGGIGACFSFISQTVLANAKPGDGDAAASSIPTMQLVGLAIGAALAGIVANATGFSGGLSAETASNASLWVPGAFAVFSFLAAIAAAAANRVTSR